MIVDEILINRNPGCIMSETSKLFPSVSIKSILEGYDASYYEVCNVLFEDDKPVSMDKYNEILAALSQHQQFAKARRIEWPAFKTPPISLRIYDGGSAKGALRPIIYEKEASFPQFQMMSAKDGKETYYVALLTKEAETRLMTELKSNIGKDLVSFRTLKTNATDQDVIHLVPSFFEVFLPEELHETWKSVFAEAASGSWDSEKDSNYKKMIETVIEKYPWILKWILKVLAQFFKLNVPDC
ncbi:hypothetical protein MUP59_07535 [Candidatus Bathyarchaeota archaeon]|nr:hypothetical protein [Candidatus Bathyarchaeota archaeon]